LDNWHGRGNAGAWAQKFATTSSAIDELAADFPFADDSGCASRLAWVDEMTR